MTRLNFALYCAMGCGIAASPAFAQSAASTAPQASAEATVDSSDIVVTAQHRQERLQDVPIAVTALSGQTLKNMAVNVPQDVFAQIPSVHVQTPSGPASFPLYNIRGVTLLDFSYISESSIASYRDEIYQGNTGLGSVPIFDLERVEVLRGPQGTLYGRNATGGLINFISARPTADFTANASVQYGNYNDILATGAVSGPLAPNIRGRLAIRYNSNDGYMRNAIDGKRYASVDSAIALRGILDIDATDNVLVTLNAHYSHQEGQNDLRATRGSRVPGALTTTCAPAATLAGQCVNSLGHQNPTFTPHVGYTKQTGLPYYHSAYGGFAKVVADFDSFTLTSITGIEHIKKNEYADLAGTNIYSLNYLDYFGTTHDQISQEIRLNGDIGAIQWQTGAFLYHDKRLYTTGIPGLNVGNWSRQKINSQAVFGQVTYAVGPTFNLTAGGRYTWDHKKIRLAGVGLPFAPNTSTGTVRFLFNDKLNDKQFTWRLGADWHPTDDVMVFASASTGYKLGGYNATTVTAPTAAGPVDSEKIISYEVGVKAELIDKILTANITGYYSTWKDIQASITVNGPGGTVLSTYSNIGKADIRGLEAELRFRPRSDLSMNVGLALNHNKLDAPGIIIGGRVIDGNVLANMPKTGINAAISWEPELPGGSRFLSGIDGNHQTKIFFRPDNAPIAVQGAYTVVNARIGWAAPNDRYRVELFSKNLFDKHYFVSGSVFADEAVYHWATPRTYGIRVSANF